MIGDFLDSWALFRYAYLTGWLSAMMLSLVGILVIARNQIFVSVAVSQASTLGIAVSYTLGALLGVGSPQWLREDGFASAMAIFFAVVAALVTSRPERPGTGERAEAVTGWVFLVSASGSVLLLAHSPHGLEEIHRLLFSSLIGATGRDAAVTGALLAVTGVALALFRRRIVLLVLDPVMASAVGVRTGLWALVSGAWLGVVVGFSMQASGLLYTFGCLVLPPLIAKNLVRETRPLFVATPLIAVLAAITGFVVANRHDYPPAQVTVALLCAGLVLAWIARRLRGA